MEQHGNPYLEQDRYRVPNFYELWNSVHSYNEAST